MTYFIEGCPCDSCKLGQAAEEERKAAAPKAVEAAKIPTSRVLTREMVLRNRPCSEYRYRFMERFPVSVEVTKELAVSQAEDWDWWWAAEQLLSFDAYRKFSSIVNRLDNEHDARMTPLYNLMNDTRNKVYAAQDESDTQNYALTYRERQDLRDTIRAELMGPAIAARDAAYKVSNTFRLRNIAAAWAELFLADEEAYNLQHQQDIPFVEGRDGQWAEEEEDEEPDWYNDYEEDEDY